MKLRLALCVGINRYPNAPLQGCVNDASDWSQLLQQRGYSSTMLLDTEATKAKILQHLRDMVEKARFGDRLIFTYSGHGSWVPDMSGDEPDHRDEVLCAIDYERGGYILDDELEEVFRNKRFGVRVTIFSDSCFSGSVSRFVTPKGVPRFVHPSTFLVRPEQVRRIAQLNTDAAITAPRATTNTVLFSGCADNEVSWDAYLGGKFNGAFTESAIRTFQSLEWLGFPSYGKWHNRLAANIDTETYPQHPQLTATPWQRTWKI